MTVSWTVRENLGSHFLSCFWYADDIGLTSFPIILLMPQSPFTFTGVLPLVTPRFLLPCVLRFFPFPSILTTLRLGAKLTQNIASLWEIQNHARVFSRRLASAIPEVTVLKMSWEDAGTMYEGETVGGGGARGEKGRSGGM